MNNDNAAHTATSGEPGNSDGYWDSSLMMVNGSFTVSFESFDPGTYPYHCMVHPWMLGTIIIEDAAAAEPSGTVPPTVTASAYLNNTSPTGRTLNLVAADAGSFTHFSAAVMMPDGSWFEDDNWPEPPILWFMTNLHPNYMDDSHYFPIPEDWESGSYNIIWAEIWQPSPTVDPGNIPSFATTTITVPALPEPEAETTPEPDSISPQVLVPDDITIETANQNGASATFNPQAIDNIDELLTPTCNYTSGSIFPIGTTTVICSATDSAGNSSSNSFNIIIELVDTSPPIINIPSSISDSTSNNTGKIITFAVTASDNIGVTSGPICSPASGSVFPIGTTEVTCTATDSAGNSSSNSFNVIIEFSGILIPDWIKNVAGFWHAGDINDASFLEGISYLIQNDIIVIPSTESGSGGGAVPEWVKNTAGWWADGSIDDETFVNAIQYLIQEGILQV